MTKDELFSKANDLGYFVDVKAGKIDKVFPLSRDSYVPEIFRSYVNPELFEIQTTSYGGVKTNLVSKIIEGLKAGQEMVKLLTMFEDTNDANVSRLEAKIEEGDSK